MPFYGCGRNSCHLCCLFHRQASEEAQLDNLRLASIECVETIQSIVESQQINVLFPTDSHSAVEGYALSTIPLRGVALAGVFDENLAHHQRRKSNEMTTAEDTQIVIFGQPQVHLVNQVCSQQRVTRSLPP